MTSRPCESPPAPFAAAAIACVIAPAPPTANCAEPAGAGSPAARIKSISALPADHGPKNVPKIPRAATVARNRSVSKYSATKSATAIGPQRSSRYRSFFPSLRRLVRSAACPTDRFCLGRQYPAASAPTPPRSRCPSCAATLHLGPLRRVLLRELRDRLRRLPRIVINRQRASIRRKRGHTRFRRHEFQPMPSNPMSRIISGRSGPAECASVEHRNPG